MYLRAKSLSHLEISRQTCERKSTKKGGEKKLVHMCSKLGEIFIKCWGFWGDFFVHFFLDLGQQNTVDWGVKLPSNSSTYTSKKQKTEVSFHLHSYFNQTKSIIHKNDLIYISRQTSLCMPMINKDLVMHNILWMTWHSLQEFSVSLKSDPYAMKL